MNEEKETFEANVDLYVDRIQNFLQNNRFDDTFFQIRALTRLIKNYKKSKEAKKKNE